MTNTSACHRDRQVALSHAEHVFLDDLPDVENLSAAKWMGNIDKLCTYFDCSVEQLITHIKEVSDESEGSEGEK